MSKKRNEQRDLALRELVAKFERSVAQQCPAFLSQEQFEDLIGHYYDSGDFDQTLYVADTAIAQHAFTPEFYKWKALIHKIHLQEDDAIGALEKLAIYAPNDEEALMLRLEVYTHFEKVDDAQELLDLLHGRVTGKHKRSLLFFFQGLIHLIRADVSGAWEAIQEAIILDPYQEPALDEALNADEFEPFQKSLRVTLDRILDGDPFNDLAWYYLGLWFDDHGKEFEALDAFANARSLNDREARYELDYADKLFDLDFFEAALTAYASYFDLPDAQGSYDSYIRIGRSHQMLGDRAKAKAAYFKAAEAEPDTYDSYQHLGECFAAEGKWGMAAHNYGRAVELPGHTPECWLGLALCLSALNETEEAEPAFLRAISLSGQYSDAVISYAIFLADNGREEEALALMDGRLAEYEDAGLLYGMVAVCLICNRRSRAFEYLNEALAGHYEDRNLLLDWYPELLEDTEVAAIFRLYED